MQGTFHLAAALFVAAPAAPAAPPATEVAQASQILSEASRIYDEAGDPALVNDANGRLAIYERALAHLDRASPDLIQGDAFRIARLFYRTAIAMHRPRARSGEDGSELEALLPELRAAARDFPDSARISSSLSQVLRFQANAAMQAENFGRAAGYGRESVERMRAIVALGNDDDFTLRALAIDLDNLARIEARLGRRDRSDALGGEALGLFRQLAQRQPGSRAAQGSLLISLVRRAVDMGEPELLDEAERVGAGMAERGLLDERYRGIVDGFPRIRAQAGAAAAARR